MKNLKLNALASERLSEVEMNQVKGGVCCTCGCQGPSSTNDNGKANMDGGKVSTQENVTPFYGEELPDVIITPGSSSGNSNSGGCCNDTIQ